MHLLHSKAQVGNPEVRNLDMEQALSNLMEARLLILELFQTPAWQLLAEYLVARHDLNVDSFFEKKNPTLEDTAFVRGQNEVLHDFLGLPYILKTYKVKK